MRSTVHLRAMREDDIPAGLRLCRLANWNQVAADWRFFLASSPRGCTVAVDGAGHVIGTAATMSYGGTFSWIGMVLVDPEYRRAGIGTRLLREALDVIGDATVARLDATPDGRNVYVPLGFHDEYELQRMVRPAGANADNLRHQADRDVRLMTDSDFTAVVTFDSEIFGADRSALLDRLRSDAPQYAWTIGDGRVEGSLFGRPGHSCEHLGPLVARDETSARRLVSACTSAHADRRFLIDVPSHLPWVEWLTSEGFTLERPFTRMRRGALRYRERLDRLFAIAGPEFG